jgi:hypothetical protein
MIYIKKFKTLAASDDCHVIATRNIFINTTTILLEANKGSRAEGSVMA